MEEISVIIEGNRDAREAVRGILREELDTEPRIITPGKETGTKDPGLVMAAAALVLSVPAAVLAALDLKKRLAVRKKLEGVLSRVESLDLKMKDGLSISIRTGDGRMLRLKKSSLPEVVEALSRMG